jgi:hypothetical protein
MQPRRRPSSSNSRAETFGRRDPASPLCTGTERRRVRCSGQPGRIQQAQRRRHPSPEGHRSQHVPARSSWPGNACAMTAAESTQDSRSARAPRIPRQTDVSHLKPGPCASPRWRNIRRVSTGTAPRRSGSWFDSVQRLRLASRSLRPVGGETAFACVVGGLRPDRCSDLKCERAASFR